MPAACSLTGCCVAHESGHARRKRMVGAERGGGGSSNGSSNVSRGWRQPRGRKEEAGNPAVAAHMRSAYGH